MLAPEHSAGKNARLVQKSWRFVQARRCLPAKMFEQGKKTPATLAFDVRISYICHIQTNRAGFQRQKHNDSFGALKPQRCCASAAHGRNR
jgi:hypothetical protein